MDFIEKIYREIGESDFNQDVRDFLSTGLLPLNKAMSGKYDGGFPVGRITEVYGGPSSGKTLLATMALIQTQKKDGLAVLLDYEHAFSLSRAKTLGLSDDKLSWIYKQPATAEEGFKIVDFIGNAVREADSEKFVTVVIDSVASMVTKAELETEYGEDNMKTRLSLPMCLSVALKKLAPLVSRTNITLIFLNQTRDNPGQMFGDKETQPGGKAMKFYASTRIKLSKGKKEKDGEEIVGEKVTAQVVKNKVFEPFKTCEYITHFAEGINLPLSHIEALNSMGKLGDTKGWVVLPSGEKFRKKELAEKCRADRELYEQILTYFED
jgi:protein RecA